MKTYTFVQKSIIPAITLLAFLLRVYKLDAQSYWIDEGWTLYFANTSWEELWRWLNTEELHPPLYFPFMRYWVNLLNNSEFSTRFVSLLFSVLSVPLIYRLGKDLGDSRVGIIAAIVLAVNPYQIWHAQDARNYSFLFAAATLSMWAFVNLWQRGGWRWWLLYILGTQLAIFAHYHGLVVIGIQGLFLLIAGKKYWRSYLKWGCALVVILLPLVVWITAGPTPWQSAHWLPTVPLVMSYLRSATAYSVGELVPGPQALYFTLAFLSLYGVGLVYAASRRQWDQWQGWEMLTFLLTYTLAPNFAAWIYGLFHTSVYLERYLIIVQGGYLLAVSIGIVAVAEGVITFSQKRLTKSDAQKERGVIWLGALPGGLLLLLLLAISGWVLNRHYFDPVYAKPNWRDVIRTIENFEQPGDAIVMTGDGGEKLFDYYYQGNSPLYFDEFNTPVPPPVKAKQALFNIAANHRRIWYTPYGVDIDATLERHLAENSYPAWHRWIGRKRLAMYHTPTKTDRQETVNAVFANQAEQGPKLVTVNLPSVPVAAGDLLPLTLTWQTTAQLAGNPQLSLRLINNYGDTFTQSDWPPLAAAGSASTWPANQPITDRRSVWIPADTPPGDYLLQLVVYNSENGQSLGQPLTIPAITVSAAQITPPPQSLSIPDFTLNTSHVTHHNLQLIGSAFPSEIQPGQEMWLWLYWQAQNTPPPNTMIGVTIKSDNETASDTLLHALTEVAGPLDNWLPGQVRRTIFHLPTNPRLTGNTAQIEISLHNPNQQTGEEIIVGNIKLATRSHQFDRPAIASPLTATFGTPPQIALLGYNLPAGPITSNSSLSLSLTWQAKTEIPVNYTVFVQLLNSDNQVAAQIDSPPLAGQAPTTTWLPSEILTDPYTLSLPPNLASGNYRLIAGLYNGLTGERLKLTSGNDFVELQQVTVR